MKQELHPLITELCHIAVTRNKINTRRHRARYRKNYYSHAVRVVEAHNNENSRLRFLRGQLDRRGTKTVEDIHEIARLQSKIGDIEFGMERLKFNHPKPKKWQAMGLYQLRSLVLKGESEYAMAKHETMEYSIKHRARVKHIMSALNCSVTYDNGALTSIHFKDDKTFFDLEDIHNYAVQHELNSAVDGMLKE